MRVGTNAPGAKVDLRLHWRQAATSIVASVKDVGANSEASLAVPAQPLSEVTDQPLQLQIGQLISGVDIQPDRHGS